jgi:predicted acyl esterase
MLCFIQLIPILFVCCQVALLHAETLDMCSSTTEDLWLSMPDGIRLSATLTIPIPKTVDEKFPILLEYKPYRKDDSFYNYNRPNIHYLVQRGFIVSILSIVTIMTRNILFLR